MLSPKRARGRGPSVKNIRIQGLGGTTESHHNITALHTAQSAYPREGFARRRSGDWSFHGLRRRILSVESLASGSVRVEAAYTNSRKSLALCEYPYRGPRYKEKGQRQIDREAKGFYGPRVPTVSTFFGIVIRM